MYRDTSRFGNIHTFIICTMIYYRISKFYTVSISTHKGSVMGGDKGRVIKGEVAWGNGGRGVDKLP